MNKKVYILRAFTDGPEGGNLAGVVLLSGDFQMSEQEMQTLATELNFSETAFVEEKGDHRFSIRYFTPACEVPVCGHATIASFSLLKQNGIIGDGNYRLLTSEDELSIEISGDMVWMEMSYPVIESSVDEQTIKEICDAYEIDVTDLSEEFPPQIIRAGIKDIHICVKNHDVLMKARQHAAKISEISERFQVAGVHMSCLSEQRDITAYCSNFAPFYGIDEECATGTSNAGLTYYLYKKEHIEPGQENCFLQGEHMGCPSKIYTKIIADGDEESVWVGGKAFRMD